MTNGSCTRCKYNVAGACTMNDRFYKRGVPVRNTSGQMTSQNLWPRNDRHFVGITWHNVWNYRGEDLSCYLDNIQSVGLWKCVYDRLPTKRISAISQWKTKHLSEPTRWRRKPASIEITSLSPCVLMCVAMGFTYFLFHVSEAFLWMPCGKNDRKSYIAW